VFACTGNPEEEDSYSEIARGADTITVSGLDENAYVTLADDAWTLTGVLETEEDQELSLSFQNDDMEEAATATLAITVVTGE